MPALLLLAPLLMGATYTRLDVSWPLSTEPDLYAYVVHWGTQTGVYSLPAVTVLKPDCSASTCSKAFLGLDPALTYFFALTAIDEAGNESALSPEASGSPRLVTCSPPVVTGAEEAVTGKPYLPRCYQRQVRVLGSNFGNQVSVSFPGSAILVLSPVQRLSSTELLLEARAEASATPGPTDMTVMNEDTCSATLSHEDPNSLVVIRSPDFDGDGVVGALDLNRLAIAFGSQVGGARYNAALDLNGDDIINGEDVDAFGAFLVSTVPSCP